ncbi:MAG: c-type cytochrome [Terriglobales bacterium]
MFLRSFRRLSFRSRFAALAIALLAASVGSSLAQNKMESGKPAAHPADKTSSATSVARGKYIVEGVAMCGTCHTPADSNGNPDRSRWLQGSSVPYMPAKPDSDWPISAPRIGGTLPADEADMIKLLTTGIWTTGNRLRLPMPQFRMDRSDAEAVVAYLKTVTMQP